MSISTDYSYYNSTYYNQQTEKKQKQPITSLLDSNDDKIISNDELTKFVTEISEKTGSEVDNFSIMSKYDANANGELDESEQEAMNEEKVFEKLFLNGMQSCKAMMIDEAPPFPPVFDQKEDGLYSDSAITELANMVNGATGSGLTAESLLETYDLDGDGTLSESELDAMLMDTVPPQPNVKGSEESSSFENEYYEKIEELRRLMEEDISKKKEEKEETAKHDTTKQYIEKQLIQSMESYEKTFLFESTDTVNVKYGA